MTDFTNELEDDQAGSQRPDPLRRLDRIAGYAVMAVLLGAILAAIAYVLRCLG